MEKYSKDYLLLMRFLKVARLLHHWYVYLKISGISRRINIHTHSDHIIILNYFTAYLKELGYEILYDNGFLGNVFISYKYLLRKNENKETAYHFVRDIISRKDDN